MCTGPNREPRAPAFGRLGTLSAAERRVASLAVAGLTHDEIARRLSLNPRTVEWNLAKVFRKLQVRSVAELAPRLERGR
jgi:DNA-binding CsgD family transcriptional regulator